MLKPDRCTEFGKELETIIEQYLHSSDFGYYTIHPILVLSETNISGSSWGGGGVHKTTSSFYFESWRNEMKEEIDDQSYSS